MDVSRATEESIKVWIALGGVVLPFLWHRIPQEKVRQGALIGLTVIACLNYVRYDFSRFRFPDGYDLIHYYMSSRYFDEVGYFDLYPAAFLVDQENGPYDPDHSRVRLTTSDGVYEFRPLGDAIERGRELREQRFTPERWASFERDFLYLQRETRLTRGTWRDLTEDHGFNGTPTWLMVARPLAQLVPATQVNLLCLLDILLLFVALALLRKAYGWPVMLWTLYFLAVTYSWRWTVPGRVFLRHDWFCSLLIAVALIKLGKPLWAGVATGYGGLMRLFPVVWLYGVAAKAAALVIKQRRLDVKAHRQALVLALGFTASVVVLEGATAAVIGVDTIREHIEKISEHVSTDELTSRRIGFAIGYGHHWRLRPTHITPARKAEIAAASKERLAIAFVVLLALAWGLRRSRDDEAYAYGFVPFFLLSTASYYYYSARATLVVAHAADLEKLRNRVGLASLFAIEVFANWAETRHAGHRMFLVGGVSQLLMVYVVLMTGWLIYDARRADALEAEAAAKAAAAPPPASEPPEEAPAKAPAEASPPKRKGRSKRKKRPAS